MTVFDLYQKMDSKTQNMQAACSDLRDGIVRLAHDDSLTRHHWSNRRALTIRVMLALLSVYSSLPCILYQKKISRKSVKDYSQTHKINASVEPVQVLSLAISSVQLYFLENGLPYNIVDFFLLSSTNSTLNSLKRGQTRHHRYYMRYQLR